VPSEGESAGAISWYRELLLISEKKEKEDVEKLLQANIKHTLLA
jgi:hypothetical protein